MYCPQSFSETDLAKLHDFIEAYSFATLVSLEGTEPFASHIPFLLDRERGSQGTLIGHLSAANPQASHADGQPVLVIFQGPHAYISPSWYAEPRVVPTWNYIAVHARGILRMRSDRDWKRSLVERTTQTYESNGVPHPADADFVDSLLDAISGFEIEIDTLQGKWKLNQNHSRQRRLRVITALRESGGDNQVRIADAMSESLDRESTP